MPPNETSALLKNYRNQQYSSDCNHNDNSSGYRNIDDNNHIVYVNKDVSEYEPIFSLDEYSAALTLDELLPYTSDPWWQTLRRILLFTFWLLLLTTFSAACLLSYLQSGQSSCNILEEQMSSNSAEMLTSSSNSILAVGVK